MEELEAKQDEKAPRDYTRAAYQNLMQVIEFIEQKSPLPVTQKMIAESTGLSKNTVFDVCWNLNKRGWAEDSGDGSIRLKKSNCEQDAYMGRMVKRLVRDAYGVDLEKVKGG